MLFKFFANLSDAVASSIAHHRILKAALVHLGSNTPTKDKFLPLYRYCEFNVDDSIEKCDEFLKLYENKPLDKENYRKFKSHMKAAYFIMLKNCFEALKFRNIMKEYQYKFLIDGMKHFLNKSEHLAPTLLDIYEKQSTTPQGMVQIISKECFNNRLKFNETTSRQLDEWFFDFRNYFELKEIGTGIFK